MKNVVRLAACVCLLGLIGCSALSSATKVAGAIEQPEWKDVTLKLSDLDSDFEEWEGGPLDIFAENPKTYKVCGYESYDQYMKDVAITAAMVDLSKHVIGLSNKGNMEAKKAANTLATKAEAQGQKVANLTSSGNAMVTGLPGQLKSKPLYATVLEDMVTNVKASVGDLKAAGEQLPALAGQLSQIKY